MRAHWFVRGDLDGFVGLFVDNLLQLLLIAVLCPIAAGLPESLVVGRILPAAALSILAGNLFYTWQARRLAARSGRDDVTALPYGINTVSLIAFIFLIMGPIWQQTKDPQLVWQAGVFACMASGLLEIAGAFVVDPLRRFLPRAALLSTLAGVAITFIAMGFAFQIFASPAIALLPMLLILFAYAGKVRLPFGIPAGLVAILCGIAVAWALRGLGIGGWQPAPAPVFDGPHWPVFDLSPLVGFLRGQNAWAYFSVIFPMALFNVIGSLQCLESAEAAGDRYETRSSLVANGLGSLLAACFGSAFPTTIYIGHPGWKAMGARLGYSVLNGAVITAICLAGAVGGILHVVPLEATLGILIWIGIVIAAQAFQVTPREHAPAVAVGLIPPLAAWASVLIGTALRAAGSNLHEALPGFAAASFYVKGMIALDQGFLLSSMLLAAMVAFVIDRRWVPAATCALVSAALAFLGIIHGYSISPTDGVVSPHIAWGAAPDFALAYAAAGIALLCGARLARGE